VGSIIFDGDTIEFVTKYYENRTIQESFNELKASKKIFLDRLNETKILPGPLTYPQYNIGINMFMSNQKKLVLFNNGTFHFHITLPTLTEDSRIVDYAAFDQAHHKAIYLLQWFEPLFIATLGSPDIMAVISDKFDMEEKFAGGSMRNAMSRYTGVGTYHKSMPKGKVLTFPVEEFRKLLNFKKEENIWWRDRIESELCYELLSDVGLDFNREKLYQSGYEFRSFDEFPTEYLPEVLHAIVLISEHAQHEEEIEWASNNVIWNNLVFKTLTQGYKTEMTEEEKNEIVRVFKLPASLQNALADVNRLDEFFFRILQHLHDQHNDNSEYLKAFLYEKAEDAPRWGNFNEHQVEQHEIQINTIS
jgi:hypothetical protein